MTCESRVLLCVPRCVVLFVAVSPIPLGGVRLLSFYRIVIVYRFMVIVIEIPNFFRFVNFFLSNDISKVSVRYPTLPNILRRFAPRAAYAARDVLAQEGKIVWSGRRNVYAWLQVQTGDLKMPRAPPPCSRKTTQMPHAWVYRVYWMYNMYLVSCICDVYILYMQYMSVSKLVTIQSFCH